MSLKSDVEDFRKAVVIYKRAAEKFIWAAYENPDYELTEDDGRGFRSPAYESFRKAQSALVVTCHRLQAAVFLLGVIEDGHKPILKMHHHAIAKSSGAIGGEQRIRNQEDLLSDLLDAMEHIQRLELFGGLWEPIETRKFSHWYWTTDILKRAGRDGEPMPDRTWQKHRKRLGNQIESHPQSGAQKVRLTRLANDDLGLNLPEFQGT